MNIIILAIVIGITISSILLRLATYPIEDTNDDFM